MKSKIISVLLITLYTVSINAQTNKKYTTEEIRSYYQDVLDQTAQLATKQPLDKESLRQMLRSHMNIDWMATFSLGKYRNKLGDEEKNYINAYQACILRRATAMFSKHYKQGRIVIYDVNSRDNGFFLVKTKVKGVAEEPISVDYGIKTVDEEKPRIIDIMVEHISMINTDRENFDNILSQKGIKFLIRDLTKK